MHRVWIRPMTLLSPRIFVLPLIAIAVIAGLSRGPDTSAGTRSAVTQPARCAPSSTTPCIAAAPGRSMVR